MPDPPCLEPCDAPLLRAGVAIQMRTYLSSHLSYLKWHRYMMPLKQGKILAPSQCMYAKISTMCFPSCGGLRRVWRKNFWHPWVGI